MSGARATGTPLRVASLAKQIPQPESLRMEDGHLVRAGVELEMNAYCRRAVAEGVTLATETGGSCTVLTLGPASAEDVLREAIAWGAGAGIHLSDPAFAGSDTLATARTLAAALRVTGPYDLVLLGRNSLDGETGQVGPELAQLLDLPFASGVRALVDLGDRLRLELEHDDGTQEVEIQLPAVLSVAERLCDPCKVDPEGRAAVPASRLRRLGPADLGPGRGATAGSPTIVGEVHPMEHDRALVVLDGPVDEQVEAAVRLLDLRGALDPGTAVAGSAPEPGRRREDRGAPSYAVLDEPGRGEVAVELVAPRRASARRPARRCICCGRSGPASAGDATAPGGTDLVVELAGSVVPEDVADALTAYVTRREALGHPGTEHRVRARGGGAGRRGHGVGPGGRRRGAGRCATTSWWRASRRSRAPWWPTSRAAAPTQLATVRPGVLPVGAPADGTARRVPTVRREAGTRGRVRILGERRNDDVETLARAEVVIGVGTGVAPAEYEVLSPLAALLGAELAATRKVTDKGWAPRSRQVGITGRSIAPRLYVAARAEREVQPHGGGPRGGDDPRRERRPRRARLRTLRHRDRGRLARDRAAAAAALRRPPATRPGAAVS